MPSISEAFQQAIQDHQAGRLQQAESIYRAILAADPQHVNAIQMLGVIATQVGQHQAAYELLVQAANLAPFQADIYCNLGSVSEKLGDFEKALALYTKALELNPLYAEAHNNHGLVLRRFGHLAAAEKSLERALELKPNYPDAYNNYSIILSDQGKCDQAARMAKRATELRPTFIEAYNNWGIALMKSGKYPEAIEAYQHAIELNPNFTLTYNNLGNVLVEQGALDDAIQCYHQALSIDPNYADAYCNLGSAFQERGQMEAAVDAFQRALELAPTHASTHYNLGRSLQYLGRHEESIAALEQAIKLRENYGEAAGMLMNQHMSSCDWPRLEVFSQWLLDQKAKGKNVDLIVPFYFQGPDGPATAEEQLHAAQRWVARTCNVASQLRFVHPHQPDLIRPRSKLKLGYLSSDLHCHATAWLMTELIELHDRERFEVIAYSYGVDDRSPMRRRIVNAFDRFVEVGHEAFAKTAQRIYDDQIDILIDLKGYTEAGRTKILAFRPAPIQVSYLGFPATMGADFIDYLIVDEFIAPLAYQPYYSERLVHLPGCYQVNDSTQKVSTETPTRSECGLPDKAFVFCSFNANYKINRDMFDVWMRLLTAVPESVLWLIEATPHASENIYRAAEVRGIARKRIVFAPQRPLLEHLPRYRLADLFIDTFPVNAHTTASDALRMELPLVTLAGQTFASRVAGSLLRAVGLDELIAYRIEDYETLCRELALQPERLRLTSEKLKTNLRHSKLYDGKSFARNLERAYQSMWNQYSSGKLPQSIIIE